MDTGTYISGGGHAALILGLLLGGVFGAPPPPPPETADVSIITSEQFAALTAGTPIPQVAVDVPDQILP